MINQQRRSSQQMTNSKKPIKPIEITLTKKNYAQRENTMRGSSYQGIQINTKISVHNTKNKDTYGLSINTQRNTHQLLSSGHHPLGAKVRKPLMQPTLNISNHDQLIIRCSNTNKNNHTKASNCIIEGNDHYEGGWSQYDAHMVESVPVWVDGKQNQQGYELKQRHELKQDEYDYMIGQQRMIKTVRPKLIESVSYRNMSQSMSNSVNNKNTSSMAKNKINSSNQQALVGLIAPIIVASKQQSNHETHYNMQLEKQQQQKNEKQSIINQHINSISNTNNNDTQTNNINISEQVATLDEKQPTISVAQYRELQQRLQKCLQAMGELQMNNASAQRITQLQNQILQMSINHDKEKQQLISKIQQHKLKEQQLLMKIAVMEKELQEQSTKQRTNVITISDTYSSSVSYTYSQQLNSLKQQLNMLSSLQQPSYKPLSLNSSFHSIKQSVNVQNIVREIEILRRKMLTLQQMLSAKRTQILNKDHMIKLLIKQQTLVKKQLMTKSNQYEQHQQLSKENNHSQSHLVDEKELQAIIDDVYRSIEIKLQLL